MDKAKMVYETETTHYEWHGGEYIGYGPIPEPGEEFTPVEVLNVWDYGKSQPYIPVTLEAFSSHCEAKETELAQLS